MKTLFTTITLFILILFSSFTNAEIFPEKVIAVNYATSVEGFYNQNKNYKNEYTVENFDAVFCSLNPQYFKKGCSEKAFRNLPKGKIWYFPALPNAKIGSTIRQAYRKNEIYRKLFKTLVGFKTEVNRNNNTTKYTAKTRIKKETRITSRPETYLIAGENSKTVTVDEKMFEKAERGGYYRLVKQSFVTKQTVQTVTQTTKRITQKEARQKETDAYHKKSELILQTSLK